MSIHIGWPQAILLVLVLAEVAMVGTLHGKPRRQPWNVYQDAVCNVLWLLLLYWGGFFRG